MKLLVVRHARAEERDEFAEKSSNDDLRPLTKEGGEIMRSIAPRLREWCGAPDMLVSSPLVRAVQTAEILAEEFGFEKIIQTSTLAPDEAPLEFVRWLARTAKNDDPDFICIVGHEPHLGSLISYLLTGEPRSFVEMKKSGACLLEFPNGHIEEGAATLRWLVPPKLSK
ncbi:MAG TPA: histidine phosphatase family protein [Bdellovibrionales bacterium]|nr:histidine phosphatase family protein [Bdellovibrionales bacterium]